MRDLHYVVEQVYAQFEGLSINLSDNDKIRALQKLIGKLESLLLELENERDS